MILPSQVRAIHTVIAAMALSITMIGGASAQPPLPGDDAGPPFKRLTLEELSQVVVTSVSKEPEAIWRTPAAIYVLTHDDLQRAGVTAIADALRLVPGVEVAQIDSSRNWVVGIRGFGDQFSKSVLVLIDGRSVYTPLFAGVEWSTQDTLLEDVDRIEVIRGPGGTVWGGNAVNGVINIITRSAADTHGVHVEAGGGNVTSALAGARYGGSASGVDYRAYAKGFTLAPQFHTDGRDFDNRHAAQAGFRLDWHPTAKDSLSVHGDLYDGTLGESVRVATFAPAGSTLLDGPEDVSGQNLVVRWDRDLGDGANLMVQSYFDRTYRLGLDFGETRDTFDLDVVHRRRLRGRQEIIAGAGFRSSPSTFIQTVSAADFQPHALTNTLYSAFAQDTIDLVPKTLAVSVGAKLEHNNYTGIEIQPSIRLLWTPTPQQTLWGAVTRAVRTPSRIDEDIRVAIFLQAKPATYAILSGNPGIQPEQLVSTEAGYRTLLGRKFSLDVTGFYNRHQNLVALGAALPATTQSTDGLSYAAIPVPWANGIGGTSEGFEVAPSGELTSFWRVSGSYSFLHLNLANRPGNTDRNTLAMYQGATPSHQVVVTSQLDLRRGWHVDPTYRYVSARAFGDVPGYQTADIRVAWRARRMLELSVTGQNLLQAHHPEWARDPGPTVEIRRSIYAQAAWGR